MLAFMFGRLVCVFALLWGAAGAQEPDEEAPVAEAPPAFRVAGVVVAEVGGKEKRPVAGALVSVWGAGGAKRFLAKGETDSEGRFDIGVSREVAELREHAFGPVRVVVKAAGLATEHAGRARAGARNLDVLMLPAVSREGVVVDARNNPVPAMVVQIRTRAYTVFATTTTDENGRYRFEVPASFLGTILAIADGFTIGADDGKIQLPTERIAEWSLVDEQGNAIAGARIDHEGRAVAVSDGKGRIRLPTVPRGDGTNPSAARPFSYSVHAPGYEVGRIRGADDGGELRLVSVEPLRGQVVDGDGKVIEGARVAVGRGLARVVAWSDRHGMFRFDEMQRGVMTVEATARGYIDAALRTEVGLAADRITLRLIRGAEVEGRVTHDGKPLMGAYIAALSDLRETGAATYSDNDGRFLLTGIPAGATHVGASSGRDLLSPRVMLKSETTLAMRSAIRLFGVVVTDAGTPLGDTRLFFGDTEIVTDANGAFDLGDCPLAQNFATIRIPGYGVQALPYYPGEARRVLALSRLGSIELTFEPGVPEGVQPRVLIVRREDPRIRRSNRWGPGEFKHLPAGTYDLTITAWGHLDYHETITVEKSMTLKPVLTRGGTLQIKSSPGAKVIVQTLSGKPAPVVVMELADGSKTVRGFGPGEYRFIGRAKGELIVVRTVTLGPNAPGQVIDLRGGKESTLVVTVKNRAGDPVVGARVVIESSGFAAPPTRTDENGRAELARLFSGKVRVTASHGELLAIDEIDIEPAKTLELALTLGG